MSATETNKFPSIGAETCFSQTFEFPTDSIEFLPAQGNCESDNFIFVCGNYMLKDNCRIGRTILSSFSPESRSCQLHEVIESAAVLDLKWSYQLHSDRHWLGQANADGELRVYSLPPSNSQFVTHRLDLQFNSSKLADGTLALSLDWNDRLNRCPTVRAAASFSDGSIRIFDFGESSDRISPLSIIKAHELEAWIVAFDHFEPNVIYSGADDCTFKGWDLRQPNRVPSVTNNSHKAGVCSIHSHPHSEHVLATGSYDEKLRIFDTRNLSKPVSTFALGGGVWRVKFHPQPQFGNFLLAACMHNGFHVVNLSGNFHEPSIEIASSYYEHDSIAYGSDWCHSTKFPDLIGSCSFYDGQQKIWRCQSQALRPS